MPIPDPVSTERRANSPGRSGLVLRPGVTAWCYGQERTSDQTDRADPSVTIRIRTGGQRWVSPDDDSRPARWRHFCTSRKRGAEILYCRHDNIFANLGMVSDAGTGHRA